MVGYTYVRVKDLKVVIILSISTVEPSNEDQALLMDVRKKDMINNSNVIMIILMLEPLELSPVTSGFCFRQFTVRVVRGSSRPRFESTTELQNQSSADSVCKLTGVA